jgi:isopenicillin-N epimerase
MAAIGADFYSGNCHKWLCAPKGSAFLYTRPERQPLLEPLVVSWGWEAEMAGDSLYIDHHQWLGTKDPAAYLAVPAAIQFQADHDWPAVRRRCHQLVGETVSRVAELTNLAPLYPSSEEFFGQMAVMPLPPCDVMGLKNALYNFYRVELPIFPWNGHHLLRVCIQGYNSPADVDALLEGLRALLPSFSH